MAFGNRSRPYVGGARGRGSYQYKSPLRNQRYTRGSYGFRPGSGGRSVYRRSSRARPVVSPNFRTAGRTYRKSNVGLGGLEQAVVNLVSKSDVSRSGCFVVSANVNQPNVHFDLIPLDGVRVRFTCLTHPTIVEKASKKFDGKVCWYGFSEKLDLEFGSGGPFVHRRVVFRSPATWPVQCINRAATNNGNSSEYSRFSANRLSDINTAGCMHRLFGDTSSVRSILNGNLATTAVTKIEDRTFYYNGNENGVRRSKKFWNAFGMQKKGTTMKYRLSTQGDYSAGEVLEFEGSQHIYVCDVFQYGLSGLEIPIPTPHALIAAATNPPSGQPAVVESRSHSSSSSSKRSKVETPDSEMDGLNLEGGPVVDHAGMLKDAEQPGEGVVRVLSTLKLYWYDPK